MAVSLQKLQLRPGDVVADIGCGTGKVAMAMSKVARRVIAVDTRGEAIKVSRQNLEAGGRTNIELRQQDGLEFLRHSGPLNGAFVGGTKHLPEMLDLLSEKVSGRIVVNAVLLSTLDQAVRRMTDLDIFKEAVQVQVCRSYNLAGSVMFRPIDPVFIIVGEVG